MDFPALIKGIRADLLITQTELADILGVSFATVNRWENGHHEPTIKQKRALKVLCQKKKIQLDGWKK